MSTMYFYRIHETSDIRSKVIFQGGAGEVIKYFELDSNKLNKIRRSKKKLIFGQYKLEAIRYEEYKQNIQKEIEKEQRRGIDKRSKFRKQIDTIEQHLDIYGNTIIYKNFGRIVNALEKDGYFVGRKHEPKRVIKNIISSSSEVFPECEILTLVRKETIEEC